MLSIKELNDEFENEINDTINTEIKNLETNLDKFIKKNFLKFKNGEIASGEKYYFSYTFCFDNIYKHYGGYYRGGGYNNENYIPFFNELERRFNYSLILFINEYKTNCNFEIGIAFNKDNLIYYSF